MQVVILAGGLGTRLSEETTIRPKPMVEVGGQPLLWHIMKMYSRHGLSEFIICLGYKGYIIKEYFANYFLHTSDVTIDLRDNSLKVHHSTADPWKITLVDTGESTLTGGRLKRIKPYLNGDGAFCMTYGDGVSDVNIGQSIRFASQQNTLATVTAVRPPGRFGNLQLEDRRVQAFREKPQGEGGWINGGFFVLRPEALSYVDGDDCSWELEPMERLAADGQLSAFLHEGFWQPMDTLRDKKALEALWASGNPPWMHGPVGP